MIVELRFPDSLKTPLANFKFLQQMLNRVAHGGYKHGGESKGGNRNWVPRLKQAVKDYESTGNSERLLDVANYAMYEATLPDHPSAHFEITDSRGFRKVDNF